MKRLQRDLRANFDPRADPNLKLCGTASVYLHGVGGRTVAKLRAFDLSVVQDLAPDILILEVGTNDLVDLSPEVVGSENKLKLIITTREESYCCTTRLIFTLVTAPVCLYNTTVCNIQFYANFYHCANSHRTVY